MQKEQRGTQRYPVSLKAVLKVEQDTHKIDLDVELKDISLKGARITSRKIFLGKMNVLLCLLENDKEVINLPTRIYSVRNLENKSFYILMFEKLNEKETEELNKYIEKIKK